MQETDIQQTEKAIEQERIQTPLTLAEQLGLPMFVPDDQPDVYKGTWTLLDVTRFDQVRIEQIETMALQRQWATQQYTITRPSTDLEVLCHGSPPQITKRFLEIYYGEGNISEFLASLPEVRRPSILQNVQSAINKLIIGV